MNSPHSENYTTATISFEILKIKMEFWNSVEWENRAKVFVISAFWPLDNISKPKPNRNQLLQSLSGRQNEVMQGEEGAMVGQEGWKWKWGRCRMLILVIFKRLCTPTWSLWWLMNIAVVASVLWSTTFLYTFGFEEMVSKRNNDPALNLWLKKKMINFPSSWETLHSTDTKLSLVVWHILSGNCPTGMQGQDNYGTR